MAEEEEWRSLSLAIKHHSKKVEEESHGFRDEPDMLVVAGGDDDDESNSDLQEHLGHNVDDDEESERVELKHPQMQSEMSVKRVRRIKNVLDTDAKVYVRRMACCAITSLILFSSFLVFWGRGSNDSSGIPSLLKVNLVSWNEDGDEDTPLFWNIPLSGGDLLEHSLASCYDLVQASNMGVLDGKRSSQALEVVQIFGDSYVNVDTTTPQGLAEAAKLGLVESGLADVIYSPMVYESTALFSQSSRRGRLFVLMRDPIERAVDMYYYLQHATWDPLHFDNEEITSLEQYAATSYVENNWLTRILSSQMIGKLDRSHLTLAKEVLRQKCVIGLYSDLDDSISMFRQLFHWYGNENCGRRIFSDGLKKSYNQHPISVEEGTTAYKLLLRNNLFDMELYEYAKQLYYERKNS